MKYYLTKMVIITIIICGILNTYKINFYKEKNTTSIVAKNIIYLSNNYQEVVYKGLTLETLSTKLDSKLNSNLKGYGEYIAKYSLDHGVDPVVATSIILVETGCYWNCSKLVKYNNNVGGMKNSSGRYATFDTLQNGIESFINNLSRNYYQKGLTTPKLMNKKYAANPNWHNDVNYYVNLINAS